jgi:hypothetical protein
MITFPTVPKHRPVGFSRTAIAGFLFVALIKIWLVIALPLTVVANSDEGAFLFQAHGLLAGHWLGAYSGITLVKIPFYSMFLALCFQAGMPVLLAQQLTYVAACAVFLIAIRPAIPTWQTWRLLLLYALLVFNPMSFLGGSRLLRNHLYASLGVLLIACALAIIIRIDWGAKPVFSWSAAFGMVLSAQWLTREESSWVLTFLLVNTFVTGWLMWRLCRHRWRRNLVLLALPYVLLGLSILSVDELNKHTYGLFATNELQSRQFSEMIGALYRVNQKAPRREYVVVPKETRERIYAASPAFAELRPALEGATGQSWAALSCQYYQVCTDNDVVYGWFLWEIRDAASGAGHQRSAVELALFFKRIAREINAACTSGKLSCQGERSSAIPPWDSRLALILPGHFWNTLNALAHFEGFSLQEYSSQGTRTELAEYRDLSRETNIRSAPKQTRVTGWAVNAGGPMELSVRDSNGQPVEFTTRIIQRPDVVSYLKSIGLDTPSAMNSGFEVGTPCTSGCFLYAKKGASAAAWVRVLSLDEGVKGFQSTEPTEATRTSGQARDLLYIDSVTRTEEVDSPLQTNLNSKKIRTLQRIGTFYQTVGPLLCVLALLLFLTLAAQCWRCRTLPISVLMTWLILGLLLTRTAALAYVDVFAMRISHSAEYTQYSYPLLLMVVGLALLDPAALFRIRRAEKPASGFREADGEKMMGQEPAEALTRPPA